MTDLQAYDLWLGLSRHLRCKRCSSGTIKDNEMVTFSTRIFRTTDNLRTTDLCQYFPENSLTLSIWQYQIINWHHFHPFTSSSLSQNVQQKITTSGMIQLEEIICRSRRALQHEAFIAKFDVIEPRTSLRKDPKTDNQKSIGGAMPCAALRLTQETLQWFAFRVSIRGYVSGLSLTLFSFDKSRITYSKMADVHVIS